LQSKICSICKKAKPITKFHRYKNGYKSACKTCRAKKAHEYLIKKNQGTILEIYPYRPKICIICNTSFIPNSGGQKACFKKCQVKLSRIKFREWRKENPERIKRSFQKWYDKKGKKYAREYCRKHKMTIKGKQFYNINKRPYPPESRCELCNKEKKKFDYHHWNDTHPEKGLWLCFRCHGLAETLDRYGIDIARKYLKMIDELNKQKEFKNKHYSWED